jgi:hypothetical protein
MAKIDTKTFAGGSIPAWALGAYQSTARDYADIVRSITDAYDKQQSRALQQERMDRQQEQFDETLEYNKQQDDLNRSFQQEKFKYEKLQQAKKDQIQAEERDNAQDYKDYLVWKDNYGSITEGLATNPDGFDAIDSILNSTSVVGNKYIRDAVSANKVINNRSKQTFTNVRDNIRDVLFGGLSDEELSEVGSDKLLLQYTGEYLKGGNTAKAIKEIMMSRTFDEMNPDVIQRNKSLYNRIDAAYDGLLMAIEPDQRAFFQNEIADLEGQLNTKIRAGSGFNNDQLNQIEKNPQTIANFANSRNMSIEEVQEEMKNGTITTKDISDFLAGRKEEEAGTIEGLNEYIDEITYGPRALGTIFRYATRDLYIPEFLKSPIETTKGAMSEAESLIAAAIGPGLGFDTEKDVKKVKQIVSNIQKETGDLLTGGKYLADYTKQFIDKQSKDLKTIGEFAFRNLGIDSENVSELAGKMMGKESTMKWKDFVKKGRKKDIALESKKIKQSLNNMRKEIKSRSIKELPNKKEILFEIDSLIDRTSRVSASKSAKELYDAFSKGAQFDFDFGLEVESQVDKALKDLEVEELIRQQKPTTTSTKEDVEYFELMNSLGRN